MKNEIAIILPYKEIYSLNHAAAASIWVKDYNQLSKLYDLFNIKVKVLNQKVKDSQIDLIQLD